ncbi:MAG: hypothetical protein ACKVWV_15975 [Planctomycetota bacterium]
MRARPPRGVVGAGFGGLAVAREFEKHDGDLIVVDPNNDRCTRATIGRNADVAQFGTNVVVRGRSAWSAWLMLHLVQRSSFRNRVNVLANWAWNDCTYDRSARSILGREVGADAPRDGDRVEAPRQLS